MSSLDLLAYIAAIVAHPGYTETFREDLKDAKTLRVPLTKSPNLFWQAVDLGRRILYLSTFGRRCGHPPCQADPLRSFVGCTNETPMPATAHTITHDSTASELTVKGSTNGSPVSGVFKDVSTDVFDYSVVNLNVIKSWFDYRKREPAGRKSSPLDNITTTSWQTGYTSDLVELLRVLTLLVAERPVQQQLLNNILNSPLITHSDLKTAGALPTKTGTTAKPPGFKRSLQQPTLQVSAPVPPSDSS